MNASVVCTQFMSGLNVSISFRCDKCNTSFDIITNGNTDLNLLTYMNT